MSIVERVVSRIEAGNRDRDKLKSPIVAETDDQRHASITASTDSSGVVKTRDISARGMLSIADDASLARNFQFLKRPLLARVFGRSRGETATGHTVLVTSDFPGAGKSFVSFNLAASIAQERMINVLLIDADPLRRNLTVALAQEDCPGLLDLLFYDDLIPADVALTTDVANLKFIPSGQLHSNATELLASQRLAEVLETLDDPDTIILIDSPPLLLTAEGRVLVEKVDHTLVVVEAGRSSVTDVSAVLKMLGETHSSTSFILNKAPESGGAVAGYYEYGYGYGD